MSSIYSLKIKHFRGIEDFEQTFGDKHCIVIIGRGDSGKSTILKAISLVLSPVWNNVFSDLDFTNRDITRPIEIEAIVKNVPNELMSLDKYGEYCQLLTAKGITSNMVDENAHQEDAVLKIRLTVDETLEPKWTVVSDREIGEKIISHTDRAKLNMFMISDYIDGQFAFSKGSPLYSTFNKNISKEDRKASEKELLNIVRNAYNEIEKINVFNKFDEATNKIKINANKLGLNIDNLKTNVEFRDNAYSGGNITLHSDDIPFRLKGKGSKRLLSMAIQYTLIQDGGIVLIDEIEQGLESDRARNITRLLARSSNGQVFITTHSKDVVLEPKAEQIFLMKKNLEHLLSFDKGLQGMLRAHPDAFFARRIISCEGATEEGIIRAFSDNLQENRGYGIAVQGIVDIDGGGSEKFYKFAEALKEKGFDVLIFCDDDARNLDVLYEKALKDGIVVVKCDKNFAIEQQLFKDLPWKAVCELIEYALNEHDGVKKILPIDGYKYSTANELFNAPHEEQNKLRELLANSAKANTNNGGWFKCINHGEFVGRIWIKYLDELSDECTLKKEYKEIIKWIGDGIN